MNTFPIASGRVLVVDAEQMIEMQTEVCVA